MLRGRVWTMVFASFLALQPLALHAGVSKSVAFTLSVTIPEHAQIPASSRSSAHSPADINNPARLHLQSGFRENQPVYLVSFVVD